MDAQPSKRFRENVNSDNNRALSEIVSSNDLTSNEDEQFDCIIPPLVANVFLAHLRDVQLLKTCRLVCSSWNIAACRSLRSCSLVCLKEGASQLTDLTVLLLRRSFGALKDLPSPFQKFHARGKSFTDPTFINLVHLPNVTIESLFVMLADDKFDQSQFGRILAANKATISDLVITGIGHFELSEALKSNEDIKLLSLKSLQFHDVCTNCSHIQLLTNMLSICKPEKIKLSIRDGDLLASLLTQDKVENLTNLELDWNGNSAKAWEHLGQFQFSKLTELTLHLRNLSNEIDLQQLHKICQNVSAVLKNFTTNIQLIHNSDLRFPCLKRIHVRNVNALSDFTQTKYPSLRQIFYTVKHPMRRSIMEEDIRHEGVDSVFIKLTDEDLSNSSFDQDLMILLTHVSRQFPNVYSLGIAVRKLQAITFMDIYRSFPNIRALRLDGECDFFSFTGIDVSLLNEYLELGRPIESIPRRQSIFDFKDLQTLWLGRYIVVTPDMINHCLPRIPNLTCVSFCWNDSLTASMLRDSLGHLNRITILNSAEKKYEAAMVQLAQMLPTSYMPFTSLI